MGATASVTHTMDNGDTTGTRAIVTHTMDNEDTTVTTTGTTAGVTHTADNGGTCTAETKDVMAGVTHTMYYGDTTYYGDAGKQPWGELHSMNGELGDFYLDSSRVIIGRHRVCHLRLSCSLISGRHCMITKQMGTYEGSPTIECYFILDTRLALGPKCGSESLEIDTF